MMLRTFLAASVVALAMVLPAAAHDRGTSYSTWNISGRTVQVTARLSEQELTHFPWAAQAGSNAPRLVGSFLAEKLLLTNGGKVCPLTQKPLRLDGPPDRLSFEWTVQCDSDDALAIRVDLFESIPVPHLHFARVRIAGGEMFEKVMSVTQPRWPLVNLHAPTADTGATSIGEYIALGIEHILTGYDHLTFLLALLLFGGALIDIAKVVTGFTVAHSITLGLTVLGFLDPDRAAIEALIGLSIALVAAENLWREEGSRGPMPIVVAVVLAVLAVLASTGTGAVPAATLAGLALFTVCYFGLLRRSTHSATLRWAIAFLFGLIHGFGFAGVLLEAELPRERLVAALLGFNVGVEVGQLIVVAVTFPVLHFFLRARSGAFRRVLVEVGSTAIVAIGTFWFVTRTFF